MPFDTGYAERSKPGGGRGRFAGLAGRERGDEYTAAHSFVFLHGLTFDHRMWDSVLDALPPDHRAIAFDLPGHGSSPSLDRHNLAAVVEAIHEAVIEADVERPVLVGHSIGAVLASMYASRHPAAAVVNVDSPVRIEPFVRLVQSLAPQLTADGFDDAWGKFRASMHIERVPRGAGSCSREGVGSRSARAQLLGRPARAQRRGPRQLGRRGADAGPGGRTPVSGDLRQPAERRGGGLAPQPPPACRVSSSGLSDTISRIWRNLPRSPHCSRTSPRRGAWRGVEDRHARAGTGADRLGLGRYERTAAQLAPAARVVVEHAAPEAHEHVLDVGCGTGNAALLAAARGARVLGVDPAARLLRGRARTGSCIADRCDLRHRRCRQPAGRDRQHRPGALGVRRDLRSDVTAAADELGASPLRAGASSSAHGSAGATHDAACSARAAITEALGVPRGRRCSRGTTARRSPACSNPRVRGVGAAGAHLVHGALPAENPVQDYSSHPLAVAGRDILEPRGKLETLQARVLETLQAANEDPASFRVTSHYMIATARRA